MISAEGVSADVIQFFEKKTQEERGYLSKRFTKFGPRRNAAMWDRDAASVTCDAGRSE